MPHIITPQQFAIILLASTVKDTAGFIIQIPEALLAEAKARAINLAMQYGTIAAAQTSVGAALDLNSPQQLFLNGWEVMKNADTVAEQTELGLVASALIILSGESTSSTNASIAYGALVVALAQVILPPGSQAVVTASKGIYRIYIVQRVLMRLITEIRVERLRRKLKLPLKFFGRKKKIHQLEMRILRFKRKDFKIFKKTRKILVPTFKKVVINPS